MKKLSAMVLATGLVAAANVNAASLDLSVGVGLPVVGMTKFSTVNNLTPEVVGQLDLPNSIMGLPGYVLNLPTTLLGSLNVGGAGLPVVGDLLGGGLPAIDGLTDVTSLLPLDAVDALPVVGDLLDTVTGALPL
jgi:hypothetical protein